jgi:PKD repeat protein
MNLDWLASTTAGRMVGDYVSTAFTADGVAHPVFMAATAPSGGRLVEAAYTASVPVGPPPVGNQPPHASFSVSPAAPQVGETVTFTDTSTDPNGAADITGRAWDLDGDGVYGDATTPTASRSFAAAGTYTVGLRVTDAAGAQDTTTVAVTVSAPGGGTPIPAGNLTANPSFETGASNWSGVGATVARTALAGAPNGGFVAKVTRTAGAYFTLDDTPATVPSAPAGATYKATAWVRAASASSVGKQAFVSLREQTAGGGFVQSANGFVTLTNTFQPVSATLTARTAGDVVDVYAGQSGGAAGDAFYVDLISVVRAL